MITIRMFPLSVFGRCGCHRKKITWDWCYFMPWVCQFTWRVFELCLQKAKLFLVARKNSYRSQLKDQTAFLKYTRHFTKCTKTWFSERHEELLLEMPNKPPKASSPVKTFFLIEVHDPLGYNLYYLWTARCD